MIGGLRTACGWLPAIFWVFYTVWNTVLTTPPAIGRLTAINILYVLMLPATLVLAWRWRQTRMAGQWAYLAFLVWVAVGLRWHDPSPAPDLIKAVFVCALALPIAAQLVIGGRRAEMVFAVTVMLTASAVSTWMVWQAFVSGFQYRTGTLLNQNFVQTLVAPGLLIALAFHLARDAGWTRRAGLAIVLLCVYASLLLGSRGVLIGEVAAVAVLIAQVRPSWRQTRALIVSTAIVIAMAQLPMIPNALWRTGWHVAARLRDAAAGVTRTTAPTPSAVAGAGASGGASGNVGGAGTPAAAATGVAPPAIADRPLDPRAAQSTALSRFVERDTGTLDKRTGLWRALAWFIVSQPAILLFGGGLGVSGAVAYQANPVFHNAHNTYLQVFADTGLVGVALLAWLFWSLMRRLTVIATPLSRAWLVVLVFWLVAGLTATVIDLHVFWVTLGVAMASTTIEPGLDRRDMSRSVPS